MPEEKQEKKEKAEREAVLKDVVKQWNTLVAGLLQAVKAWENYSKIRLENNVQLEEFPVEYQRTLLLANPKGQLDFILEDMITYGKSFDNYLRTQFIKL